VRAIGKLAAHKAMAVGATAISVEEVQASAKAVRKRSLSQFCPPFP